MIEANKEYLLDSTSVQTMWFQQQQERFQIKRKLYIQVLHDNIVGTAPNTISDYGFTDETFSPTTSLQSGDTYLEKSFWLQEI